MSAGLVIQARDEGPVRVVHLSGLLSLPDTAALMSALETALTTSARGVAVCDLSELRVPLADTLLTAFPTALRRAGGWPLVSLHLAAPPPELAARLTYRRMHRYLPVHATLDAALTEATFEAAALTRLLALDPDPAGLRVVRAAVADLWPAAAGSVPDDLQLVAGELSANAIRHVARPFTVCVAVAPRRALVAVTDFSRAEPVLCPLWPPGAPGGRGMRMVSALSLDWGVRLVHSHGKTVWAVLLGPAPLVPRSRSALRV